MKQNDFYEVNGCTEFIPVTINETYTDGVEVIVHSTTHPFRMAVKQVYQFPKQHEPQKVVVPEFIDSYIRYAKVEGMSLFIAMDNAQNKESEWIINNEETFARAWLDGYEIEQEKLYTVEIPNPHAIHDDVYILGRTLSGSIAIWRSVGRNGNKNYDSDFQLTESEIKQDFEWAWQFAKEVE
ncbi:DUF1642 domain-containing protein [Streptococcus porci]|uniref:DUF1642 domain-containing protein n=1 Tax=Streptococcus porci TaxID=502567 RepID=UPI00041325F3|nr:DUF1642 domain-containing protein [Streptococcus porci]